MHYFKLNKERKIKFYHIIYYNEFLDTPLYKRKFRIITRFIKQKMGFEKSNYKPDFEMLKYMFKWTKDFEKNREIHESRLLNYRNKLIWIKYKKELEDRL